MPVVTQELLDFAQVADSAAEAEEDTDEVALDELEATELVLDEIDAAEDDTADDRADDTADELLDALGACTAATAGAAPSPDEPLEHPASWDRQKIELKII